MRALGGGTSLIAKALRNSGQQLAKLLCPIPKEIREPRFFVACMYAEFRRMSVCYALSGL